MLNAILKGKPGKVPDDVRPGKSWRDVFRFNEDFLTATVLERLCYLDPSLLWKILQSSLAPPLLPIRAVVELRRFSFWPRWNEAATLLGQTVIPDALFQFDVGEPAKQVTLIVEAKLGFQRSRQWALEWIAYDWEDSDPDTNELEEVYLVALGGLDGRPAEVVQKLADDANRIIASEFQEDPKLKAVGADWPDLAATIYDLTRQASLPNQRTLQDVTEALALAGYRHVLPLARLVAETQFLGHLRGDSMNILKPWSTKTPPAGGPGLSDDWLAETRRLRQINGVENSPLRTKL